MLSICTLRTKQQPIPPFSAFGSLKFQFYIRFRSFWLNLFACFTWRGDSSPHHIDRIFRVKFAFNALFAQSFQINEKWSFTKSLFLRMTTSSYISIKISSSYCPIIDSFSFPLMLFIISGKKSTPAP